MTTDTQLAELEKDLPMQKRSWRIQNVGLALLVLLFLLALAGLFGRGLVSSVDLNSGPVHIAYQRFARQGSQERLLIETRTGSFERVRLNSDFVSAVRIDSVLPTPAGSGLSRKSMDLLFSPPKGRKIERVLVDYTPRQSGLLRMEIEVEGREPVRITQYIYP